MGSNAGKTGAHPFGARQDPLAEENSRDLVHKCLMLYCSFLAELWVQTRFSCAQLKPLVSLGSMVRHQSEAIFIISNKIQLRLEVVRKWGLGEDKA